MSSYRSRGPRWNLIPCRHSRPANGVAGALNQSGVGARLDACTQRLEASARRLQELRSP